jgi:hypothetical protein
MFNTPALLFAAGTFFALGSNYASAMPFRPFVATANGEVEKVLCKQGGKHCTTGTARIAPKIPNKTLQPKGLGWGSIQTPECKEFKNCGSPQPDVKGSTGTQSVKSGTTQNNRNAAPTQTGQGGHHK